MTKCEDLMIEENILDLIDYRGERVIFTKAKWIEKSIMHPELSDKRFLRNLQKAIASPQIVWQDYNDPFKKTCYYWRCGINRFVKVVIWTSGRSPYKVVSAFETNYIKEAKYHNLRQLK